MTAAVLGFVVWAHPGRAQGPPPAEPAPHVDPSALPLRRAVEELGRIDGRVPLPKPSPCPPESRDVPCFPASVEVQGLTPQQKLQRFFEDFDALYGPAPPASAPTHKEVLQHSGAPPIAGVDLLSLVRFVAQIGRTPGPPVYFLYLVRDADKAWPELREGRVPPDLAYSRPGVTYQEVAGFPDRESAQAAYERLEDALAVAAARKPTPAPGP